MNDRLEDIVERLPRHVEPERDLWPEIAAQLQPRRRRVPRATLYRLAAAVATVAIALGAYFTLRPDTPIPAKPEPIAQSRPNPEAVINTNLATVNENIAKITAALKRDPDNPLLYHFLSEAYRNQNRLMLERTKVFLLRSDMS